VRCSVEPASTRKQHSLQLTTRQNATKVGEQHNSSVAHNNTATAASCASKPSSSVNEKTTKNKSKTVESTLPSGVNLVVEEKDTGRSESAQGSSQSSGHSLSSMVTNAMTPDPPTIFVNLTLGTTTRLSIFFFLCY